MIDQHKLYLDNFRGFQNTYVPLRDVNFLVGENSSGKSSLLNILKLMAGDGLITGNEFDDEDINLGTFKDMVSAQEEDKSYFRLGMIRRNRDTPQGDMPMGVLITYEEHEALPRDTCFTCTFGSKEVAIRRRGNKIVSRVRDGVITPNTDMADIFPRWIKDHADPQGEFRTLNLPDSFDQETLLYPLSFVVQNFSTLQASKRFALLNPVLFEPLTWLAPIRTKPRRTYDEPQRGFSSEGVHTPYLIRKILSSASAAERFQAFMRKVGKDSGLFESVEIKRFGADIGAPFEVHIVLDKHSFNVTNVGYGVSQALPVLVEVLWRPERGWFAIQQPEVHLHPKAQAALGDVIFSMAREERKQFLIETHSDYMIDRFRSNFRTRGPKPTSQVLFFERKKGRNTVVPLEISTSGEMPAKQPSSYRNFFIKENMRVLGL